MIKQQVSQTVKDGAWLVVPPEGINFTTALTIACKGNEKVANLLNYFLDAATREAKRQGLDIEKIEYIELSRTLDQIIAALANHNKAACKKTIHDRMLNLTSLKYLEADSYRYTYRVYFRNVQEAFNNPPSADKPKLRGRHARKQKSQDACQDGNFNSKVKSSIRAQNDSEDDKNRIAILTSEMLDLRSRMLNLTSEMLDLRSRMLNLTSCLDDERACREALEAKFSSLYICNTLDTVIDTEGTYGATAPVVENDTNIPTTFPPEKELPLEETTTEEEITPAVPDPAIPPPSPEPKPDRPAGKGKNNRNVTITEKPAQPPEPQQQKLEMPALDAIQQVPYDEWCKMPWFRGVAPKITQAMPACLTRIAAYGLTADQMLKVRNWATSSQVDKKGYYKNKAWSIFFLENEIPKWLSAQPEKQAETKQAAPDPEKVVLWTKKPDSPLFKLDPSAWYLFEEMPLSEAKQYNYDLYGGLPGDTQTRIRINYQREERGELKRPELVA